MFKRSYTQEELQAMSIDELKALNREVLREIGKPMNERRRAYATIKWYVQHFPTHDFEDFQAYCRENHYTTSLAIASGPKGREYFKRLHDKQLEQQSLKLWVDDMEDDSWWR